MIDIIEKKINESKKYNIKELQKKSIECSFDGGLYLEFGVYQGHSLTYLSSLTKNIFYGFDSFQGLPEDWGTWGKKGTFRLDDVPNLKSKNIELVIGLFEDTLDEFLETHKENISFIHIDCDLYSSTKTIFNKMKNRFVPGTVLLFDEIVNYPIYYEHEIKAFSEFLQETQFQIECIGNSFNDQNKERAGFILR